MESPLRPEWKPACDVEVAMADALREKDSSRFAQLLMSAEVYLPELSDDAAGTQLHQLFPEYGKHVPFYTSPETLTWVFGDVAAKCWKFDFPSVRHNWPGPEFQLAVNVGTPIAVFLPIDAVADIAAGKEKLVALADLHAEAAADNAIKIRAACLAGLSGDPDPAPPTAEPIELLATDPVNALETSLQAAVDENSSDAYLHALLLDEVVVPTTSETSHTGEESLLPWLIVEGAGTPAIPMFSSVSALNRATTAGRDRMHVPFADVVLNWPSDRHVLCVNPGTTTEIMLPGEMVMSLAMLVDVPAEDETSYTDSSGTVRANQT